MYALIGMAIVMTVFVGGYAYYYLVRTVRFWYKGEMKRWIKILVMLGALLLATSSLNPYGVIVLIVYHILGFSVALDCINGIVLLISKHRKDKNEKWSRFVHCGLIPILLTVVVLGYGYVHMLDVKEKTYEITSNQQLNHGEGYQVAFLSDLHFGTTMNDEKLQKYCDTISAKNLDIVILGGDIVDERTSKADMERAFQILGGIKSKYGIFYVYGNHDSAGYSDEADFNLGDLNLTLLDNGIHCMADEAIPIADDLLLVGRKDNGYGGASSREDVVDLLSGQDAKRYVILVDHQPKDLQQNAKAGVDLQLGGHTHGGQIWPVGLMIDLLGFGEMNYGEKQIGDYTIIVSSGIAGWGYPIRTGCESEYLILQIK